jgi:hypothetical protein
MFTMRIFSAPLVNRFAAAATLLLAYNVCLAQGTIEGRVAEQGSGEALGFAVVRLVGTEMGTVADKAGRYIILRVPRGTYTVQASLLGYDSQMIDGVRVVDDERAEVDIALVLAPITLSEIVVTPGRFAIMHDDPVRKQTLTKEDIHTLPQLGEDIYRAIRRLPGVSGNDFSAKFTVRGGEHEEVLVMLDGLEMYEPFHLKDIYGGALSIVDVVAIGGIDMMTGGFPTQYANHMSGVFDISSVKPTARGRTAVGISLMNARFLTEGQYDGGRGSYFLSARRGYLDIVLSLMNEDDLSPHYYDLMAKTEYRLNDRHLLSAHVLRADDDLEFVENEDGDIARTDYANTYGWLRLRSAIGLKLSAQTVLSLGQVTDSRQGTDFRTIFIATPEIRREFDLTGFEIREDRTFNLAGLRQDWYWEATDRQHLNFGIDAKRVTSDFDYFNWELLHLTGDPAGELEAVTDTIDVKLNPDGYNLGFHLGTRYRVSSAFTVEAGGRYDRVSYTDDDDFSPRLNFVYSLRMRTAIRGGWGWFHQPQSISDLDVAYGEARFYRSQRAEHRVLGVEHGFKNGIDLRVEGYQKKLTHIRPRYENLSKEVLFFPELEEVSVFLEPERGDARGVELYLKRDVGSRFSWWASYGLSRAEERIEGIEVPKNQDQRHTVYFDCYYRPNPRWQINLAWQYRSGWPYSKQVFLPIDVPEGVFPFVQTFGPRNAARLSPYHRLDLRVNRYFKLRGGRLALFGELINLYNRGNVQARFPRNVRYLGPGTDLIVEGTFDEEWFPLLPSIGASWEF